MKTLKILIVEDDVLIARDLEHLLQDLGYHICGCADNGTDALRLFEAEAPDIALVDINVNGAQDGVDIVRAMNVLRPIPIIFLTAQADFQTVERAKSTKPAAYLLKPFDERHLHISIDLAISNFLGKENTEKVPLENTVTASPKLCADMILMKGNTIFLKQNYKFVQCRLEDLMYIEADGNHSKLHFKQHKVILRIPLSTVVERLNHENIVKVHRSYAINIMLVDEFDECEIVLVKKSIPFAATYRESFLKKFNVL